MQGRGGDAYECVSGGGGVGGRIDVDGRFIMRTCSRLETRLFFKPGLLFT